MDQLSGFSPDEIAQRLKRLGFEFDRLAKGCHEIWYNANTNRYTTIPFFSSSTPPTTLREILKQAGVSEEDFLK
jgi:predicted RNA binding protein YcfA (HicA-like mRNA interferase family)